MLIREYILKIFIYLSNSTSFKNYPKLLKNFSNLKIRFSKFLIHKYNFFKQRLSFYYDRRDYSCIIYNLWFIHKYAHLLINKDLLLFNNLIEFLIDIWSISDQVVNYRKYLNNTYTMYNSLYDNILKNLPIFSEIYRDIFDAQLLKNYK